VAPRSQKIGRRGLLPDTHAHLDAAEFADDRTEVVTRACAAGVTRILAVGTDLTSSAAALALAEDHPPVFAAAGLHPTEAHKWSDESGGLRDLLGSRKAVAVGEIGLDFVRASATRDEQIRVFRTQLQWAADYELPVSVHNRGADDEVLDEVDGLPVSVILHCFSGSQAFAERALASGCLLSFAGNVTFPRAGELREIAGAVPIDRILLESDAPVLAPQPWRGRRNEPAYTRFTAETVSEARGVALEDLAAQVSRSADALFRWGTA
jgi:TatD DNase family protein